MQSNRVVLRCVGHSEREVAQLVAHHVRDVGVGRSSRLFSTTIQRKGRVKRDFGTPLVGIEVEIGREKGSMEEDMKEWRLNTSDMMNTSFYGLRRLLTAVLLIVALSVSAQVQVLRSGPQEVLLRVQSQASCLLLPINEQSPEAMVRVIADNRCVQTLHIRLATRGEVDYYVPFALEQYDVSRLLLDVQMSDSVQINNINWDAVQTASSFPFANSETHRPIYHHTPQYGWMGTPAGLFYDAKAKLWHLYFQHNPYGSMWQNIHWGHSTSSDLLHWTQSPSAIAPSALGMSFSGSLIYDKSNAAGLGKNTTVAVYTSADESQMQSLAYSKDGGNSFTLYPSNPILTSEVSDSRDPYVFRNEATKQWNMVLACGGEVRFYASSNLTEWTYLSSFGAGVGCHDGVWEAPYLVNLPVRGTKESKWALVVSVDRGALAGGSGVQYFVGDWDGHQFTVMPELLHEGTMAVPVKWLDYGKDYYAAIPFANAPKGRCVVVGWMNNWQYAEQLPTQQFRSANTLPRELDIYRDKSDIYRVGVVPAKELKNLKGKETDQLLPAAIVEVEITNDKKPATITLANKQGEQVVMTYDFDAGTFSMDRRQSGVVGFSDSFASVTTAPLLMQRRKYTLTIYIDRCSIEVFDGDGYWTMTNSVFPSAPYTSVTVQGGKAKIFDINY